MLWEIAAYSFLLFLTMMYGLTGARSRLAGAFLFVALALYFISVRFSPYDDVMIHYADAMYVPAERMLVTPYFAREFLYWIPSSLFYDWTGSEIATLLIFDTIGVLLVFAARRRLNAPHYFAGLVYVSFVGVMGAQNVYRQFLAQCVLLLAVSMPGKRRYIVWAMAGLIQNAAFLFMPLLFAYEKPLKNRCQTFLFVSSALCILVLLPFAAGTKSSDHTGMDLRFVYLGALATTLAAAFYIRRGVMKYTCLLPMMYAVILTAASIAVMGFAQAERIGMMGIFLIMPILIYYIENHLRPERLIARWILILALSIPLMAFPSARNFLIPDTSRYVSARS